MHIYVFRALTERRRPSPRASDEGWTPPANQLWLSADRHRCLANRSRDVAEVGGAWELECWCSGANAQREREREERQRSVRLILLRVSLTAALSVCVCVCMCVCVCVCVHVCRQWLHRSFIIFIFIGEFTASVHDSAHLLPWWWAVDCQGRGWATGWGWVRCVCVCVCVCADGDQEWHWCWYTTSCFTLTHTHTHTHVPSLSRDSCSDVCWYEDAALFSSWE